MLCAVYVNRPTVERHDGQCRNRPAKSNRLNSDIIIILGNVRLSSDGRPSVRRNDDAFEFSASHGPLNTFAQSELWLLSGLACRNEKKGGRELSLRLGLALNTPDFESKLLQSQRAPTTQTPRARSVGPCRGGGH